MLTILTFDHIVLNVTDVETSAAWYARVLGMTREETVPPPAAPRASA
jgi:catechol 2,3-dioxygenase-like lactoylglutathione lyase family enzyme